MTALISKPGITSASTLAIPKDWDKTWFRNFIQNQLKGADVRNAIGTNGIKVTGNISSPYATITIGAGPIVIPAGTTSPTLSVGSITNGTAIATSASGANAYVALSWSNASGSGQIDLTAVGTTEIGSLSANSLVLFTNNLTRLLITSTGLISGWGTTVGGLVDMSPDSGSFTFTITGCTTSPTGTGVWAKMGNVVVLVIPPLSAVSNTTSMTMTGLPAEIQAAREQNCIINFLSNNTTTGYGSVQVTNTGTLTFFVSSNVSSTGFTAAGTKGTTAFATIAYALN